MKPIRLRRPRPGEPRNRDELSDALRKRNRVQQQLKSWSEVRSDPNTKEAKWAAERRADFDADRARMKREYQRNK